jgi:hypothetical protein
LVVFSFFLPFLYSSSFPLFFSSFGSFCAPSSITSLHFYYP